jgi:hypothetical protein
MSLYVAELDTTDNKNIQDVLAGVEAAAQKAGGEFIESQVTANHNRVFAVLEHDNIVTLRGDLEAAGFKVDELALVRLIGAELEDIKKLKPAGQYLVEWDFPEGLTMDKYLARKKESRRFTTTSRMLSSCAPMFAKTWLSACASMTATARMQLLQPARLSTPQSADYTS